MKYDRKFYENNLALSKPHWQARVPRILQELDPAPNDFILDVGCGVGYYVHEISSLISGVCVGVDLSSKAVRLAHKEKTNGNAAWIIGSIEHLPFRDEVFSGILCDNVIEHIPKYRDAIFEMARVLKVNVIRRLARVLKPPFQNVQERSFSNLPRAVQNDDIVRAQVLLDLVHNSSFIQGVHRPQKTQSFTL